MMETGFQERLFEKYKTCSEIFVKEHVEISNQGTNEIEEKVLIRVTDLSDFALFVINEQKLDPKQQKLFLTLPKVEGF